MDDRWCDVTINICLHVCSACLFTSLIVCSSLLYYVIISPFCVYTSKQTLNVPHRFVFCFLTWFIDSNSKVDKVVGGDERARSMSSVSTTTSWGSPPPPPLDNGNWNKNPQEFHGIFETLIDRCSFVVWAVSNSRNRDNWRLTSVAQVHNVLAIIAKFAKQPPRDVFFLRQTRKSK